MKRKNKYILLGLTASIMLAGCGQTSNENTTTDTTASTEAAEEDMDVEELLETETEAPELDPITPSDYLVENPSEYVTLGSYDGLEVVQYTYDVTDDMVDEQIQMELESAGEEVTVEDGASEGDTVYTTLTSTIEGEEDSTSEEETFFTIGDEDYGAEFDQKLLGAKADDKLSFSITFGDDTWMEDWIGKTVSFEASITSVTRLEVPEYTDEYVTEYTDYSSKEEYETALKESMTEEYEETSYYDAVESLFDAAMEKTNFIGYPQDLYDECRDEIVSSYMLFVGDDSMSEEEVLDAFGLTDTDIDTETLSSVNRILLISALCEANDITVTEDEYVDYVTEYAPYYGAENAVAFEEEYTRATLVRNLYESKVADLLFQSANITETPYSDDLYTDGEIITDEELDEDAVEDMADEGNDAAGEDTADEGNDAAEDGTAETGTEDVTEAATAASEA